MKGPGSLYTQDVSSSETAILDRLIPPEPAGLPPEAARYLLTLDFAPADLDRMNELAAKAQQGALTEEDSDELESYRHVGHLLALMQSKARRSLKLAGSSGSP